jgi:hypothetical protein
LFEYEGINFSNKKFSETLKNKEFLYANFIIIITLFFLESKTRMEINEQNIFFFIFFYYYFIFFIIIIIYLIYYKFNTFLRGSNLIPFFFSFLCNFNHISSSVTLLTLYSVFLEKFFLTPVITYIPFIII